MNLVTLRDCSEKMRMKTKAVQVMFEQIIMNFHHLFKQHQRYVDTAKLINVNLVKEVRKVVG